MKYYEEFRKEQEYEYLIPFKKNNLLSFFFTLGLNNL